MDHEWPIVGRQEEVALAAAAITCREPGRGMVVGGSAGVGKTRLCAEAVRVATRLGHRCHHVAATASSRDVPLAVFVEFGVDVDADPLRQIRDLLHSLTSDDSRHPAVVAVDDAHLLDNRSAFVVHELVVRKMANVVLSIRTGEAAPDAITALWKDHHVPRLELQPLSRSEVGALLEGALGSPVESTSLRRLHAMSDGNALLLRQLVDDQLAAGRLRIDSGLWFWSGDLAITPTLAEMVRLRLAGFSPDVLALVDLLAVSEPLTTDELGTLVSAETLELAETVGAIKTRVTARSSISIRLSHPLQGEIRRADLGHLRRRRLAGTIAQALSPGPRSDPSSLLRHAVLTLDSDLPADPDLLAAATRAAMLALDVDLAVRFASAALGLTATPATAYPHVMSLMVAGQGDAAEEFFEAMTIAPDQPEHARWTTLRAANMVWMLARPRDAAMLLDTITGASLSSVARAELAAVRACVLAVEANPAAAVTEAQGALAEDELGDFHALMAVAAMVMSAGAAGNFSAADEYAAFGQARAAASWQTAHLQFWLGAIHARVCRISGHVDRCADDAIRLTDIARDVSGPTQIQATFLRGHAALAGGRVQTAITELLDSLVGSANGHRDTTGLGPACLIWLSEAYAQRGSPASARSTLTELAKILPAEYAFMQFGMELAAAWTEAAEGVVSRAVSIALTAAETACKRGQFAYEVLALQTATQFGSTSAVERLHHLAQFVEGPRVAIAARHASALHEDDGAGLLAVAHDYEHMGDLIAAADAAAQAGRAWVAANRRGSALAAYGHTQRVARASGCSTTQAPHRTAATDPFTARQREAIALVAAGLTNVEIAERLTVSVRSVEGHLYRAAQRVGVTSRDELADILNSSRRPDVAELR